MPNCYKSPNTSCCVIKCYTGRIIQDKGLRKIAHVFPYQVPQVRILMIFKAAMTGDRWHQGAFRTVSKGLHLLAHYCPEAHAKHTGIIP